MLDIRPIHGHAHFQITRARAVTALMSDDAMITRVCCIVIQYYASRISLVLVVSCIKT